MNIIVMAMDPQIINNSKFFYDLSFCFSLLVQKIFAILNFNTDFNENFFSYFITVVVIRIILSMKNNIHVKIFNFKEVFIINFKLILN